jgi:serine/threonine protein kinase
VGTAVYHSPEASVNNPADYKSDLWSLGVTMYFLFARRYPIPLERGKTMAISPLQQREVDFRRIQNVDDDAKSLIRMLMHVDPNKRPTYRELAAHPYLEPLGLGTVETLPLANAVYPPA